jgi:mRNA interferase MazF
MMRGDLVTIAMQGDFGKPRPALIIQSNQFDELATVTVLLISSTLVKAPLFRVSVRPCLENGLQKPSQIMLDKVMTVKRDKLGPTFGRMDSDSMIEVERSLAVFLGIAK